MRKSIVLSVVAVVLLMSQLIPSVHSTRADQPTKTRTITVTGSAQINVVPDEIVIRVGIDTSDKSLTTAKNLNNDIVNKILTVAKTNDIKPEYVQTDALFLSPTGGYKPGETVYSIHKTLVVTLQDNAKVIDVLSGILEAGASNIYGIEYRSTKMREYKDQARSLAIKAAKEKAMAMTADLGAKLGVPDTITEDQLWSYSPWCFNYYGNYNNFNNNYNFYCGYNGYNNFGMNGGANSIVNAPNGNAGGQATGGQGSNDEHSAAAGQLQVYAHVTIVFELAD